MALRRPVAPDDTKKAMANRLADYMDLKHPMASELMQGDKCLPVAVLSLKDLSNGQLIANSEIVGWGFVAGSPLGPAIKARITKSDHGQELTSFSSGPEVAALMRRIYELETLSQVQTGEYDLWVLKI